MVETERTADDEVISCTECTNSSRVVRRGRTGSVKIAEFRESPEDLENRIIRANLRGSGSSIGRGR